MFCSENSVARGSAKVRAHLEKRSHEELTYENHDGRPPSRDHAHVRRDVDAMLARFTAREIIRRPQTIAVAALVDPVACWQIWMIGEGAVRASSIEPIVNNMVKMIA